MNFKDSYKSAMDEIHGDKVLLHSILNSETKQKKSSFVLKPSYSIALAAMMIITATSLYFKTGIEDHIQTAQTTSAQSKTKVTRDITASTSDDDTLEGYFSNEENKDTLNAKNSHEKSSSPTDSRSKDESNSASQSVGKTDTSSKDNAASLDDKPVSDAVSSKDAKADTTDEKNSDANDESKDDSKSGTNVETKSTNKSAAASAPLPSTARTHDEKVEDPLDKSKNEIDSAAKEDVSDIPITARFFEPENVPDYDMQISEDHASSESASSGGSSDKAGVSAADGSRSAVGLALSEESIMSVSDYWSYLGTNVKIKISLPADMQLSIPSSVTITKSGGKIISDVFVMNAASGDGTGSLTLAVSKVSNLGVLYPYAKHFSCGNIKYAITSNNINQNEINEIINSLTK